MKLKLILISITILILMTLITTLIIHARIVTWSTGVKWNVGYKLPDNTIIVEAYSDIPPIIQNPDVLYNTSILDWWDNRY